MGKGQDRVSLSPEAAQRERQEEADSRAVPGPFAATSVVGRAASSETHSPLCRWGPLQIDQPRAVEFLLLRTGSTVVDREVEWPM